MQDKLAEIKENSGATFLVLIKSKSAECGGAIDH